MRAFCIAAPLALGFVFAFALGACTAFSPRPRLRAAALTTGVEVVDRDCRRTTGELVSDVNAAWDRGLAPSATLPEAERRTFACISLRDNLARDEMRGCSPPSPDVFGRPLPARRRVVGDLAYVAIDPREYAYDLVPEPDGKLGVELRIAFTGSFASDIAVMGKMREKLDTAAALWSESSPDHRMRFRFYAVLREDNPHYVIDLVHGEPRTPFDLTWGTDWSAHLIAHEVGHMMGLDDEYGQIKKTVGHALGKEPAWRADVRMRLDWLRCDLGSLMCDSKGETAKPLPHHYYVIARRRFCRPGSAGFDYPM